MQACLTWLAVACLEIFFVKHTNNGYTAYCLQLCHFDNYFNLEYGTIMCVDNAK